MQRLMDQQDAWNKSESRERRMVLESGQYALCICVKYQIKNLINEEKLDVSLLSK